MPIVHATENSRTSRLPCTLPPIKKITPIYSLLCLLAAPGLAGAQELGCSIALDDFGAGFGSFAYLKHLPFNYLKIDGEFVRHLPRSRTDQLVVQALVSVVAGMGRQTVAECVGDQETLQMLAGYGVDDAQGFALGYPRPHLTLAA